ncbi:MAG: efflux RND transporter permease subunit [Pelagimonas sp.]|uniref:efflux RND transporter permease subunit n=1 Tax=Pelagimonas sp. TaxID=2073170 RepID=UPI003D6AF057
MHFLTGWFIRNPVAANLAMALILFMGVMSALSIRIEGFPRIPPESIIITTQFTDAPAAQVDELVTRKIEQALEGLEGVHSVTSKSGNGVSTVNVRRAGGQDLQRLLNAVRLRIDAVTNLPANVRRPVIDAAGFDFPALYVNLHGETDPATLQTLAQRLKEELLSQPELSRLNIWGLIPQELRIEVYPDRLRQLNLTVADVVAAIQTNSLNFQAGSLRTAGGDIYLRADDSARYAPEYEALPVITRPDGSTVLLRDVATVDDTFLKGDFLFRLNGDATVGMEVLIGQKENLLEISEVVNSTVAGFIPQLPSGVHPTVWGDSAAYISDRLALLRSNGVQGLLLVTLILAVFLNVRLAFWVAMGIPISVMGALAAAGTKWVDYSLNDVTTFGLIIALGILVDDAVVVGEAVYEERRRTDDPIKGTEDGVNKVAVATVFGVLTTIAAFFPMLLIDNPLGKVLAGFSGIVILALIFSLIESKFILPAHLAHTSLDETPKYMLTRGWAHVQRVARAGLAWVRDRVYRPTLGFSVHHRYAVLIAFLAAGFLGMGLIAKGKIAVAFFPEVPGQIITVKLEMDARAPFSLARDHLQRIEDLGNAMNVELQDRAGLDSPPIRTVFALVSSAQSAQIFAELSPVTERPTVGVLDIVSEWRERTGQLEGVTELQFSGSDEIGGGFQVRLLSRDADQLDQAGDELRAFLSELDGLSNIRGTSVGGQPELSLRIRPEARSLGFTAQTLASQIGYAFGGAEVQRVQRGTSEVRVIVQNANAARDTIDDLMRTQLRSDTGAWVPLPTVAEVTDSYVSGSIDRLNGQTVNTVSAAIDRQVAVPAEVWQAVQEQLMPRLAQDFPSVEVSPGGELAEMGEIQGGLLRALMLAAVLIYVLMAVPLKSYAQPFIILAIIPFGFVGAAMGHLIMGLTLSLFSFFGMLALTGVVVNDSLVLITRYNQNRAARMDVTPAIHDAGQGRFQAIFLTTATTVIGLLPLLVETSEQAQYLIPAAASLAFGEIFGTTLMLILVPVLIAIFEDIKAAFLPSVSAKPTAPAAGSA